MRTISYPVIPDTDAIKTSVSSSTAAAAYSGASLDGVVGATTMNPARTLTVKTTAHAAAYNAGSHVTFTGLDADGAAQTEVIALTAAGGGETLAGTKAFSKVTSIAVDAQASALGAFEFGVRDIMIDPSAPPRMVRCAGGGNIKITASDGSTDTLTGVWAGEQLPISPTRIYGDSDTTCTDVTLVIP